MNFYLLCQLTGTGHLPRHTSAHPLVLTLSLSLSLSLPLTLASIPLLVTDTNRCTQVLVYHSCRSCDALSPPSTHNSTCSRREGKVKSEGCGGMFPRCLIFLIDQMSFFSPFPIPFCFCVFSFFFGFSFGIFRFHFLLCCFVGDSHKFTMT